MRKMTQKLERTNLMVLLQMRMKLVLWTLSYFMKQFFFRCCNGAFASDDASNVTMIGKDKSDDTLAYDDMAHKVILLTYSYVLKIVTHIGQVWS